MYSLGSGVIGQILNEKSYACPILLVRTINPQKSVPVPTFIRNSEGVVYSLGYSVIGQIVNEKSYACPILLFVMCVFY